MPVIEPTAVFQLVSTLALPGWLWLIAWLFLPSKLQHSSRFGGLFIPLILSLFYAATALVHTGTAEGGFDTLDNVLALFSQPGTTLVGWIHFLAFDLFVGWCITRHAVVTNINRVLVIPCLLLTFLAGPVGLLLYASLQLAHHMATRHSRPATPTDPLWRQLVAGHHGLASVGIVLALSIPVFAAALVMDARTTLEINVWLKPLKFALALVVYTITLSWYCSYLPEKRRNSRKFKVFSLCVIVAIVLEMIWLIYAASIGEKAHFNQTHPTLTVVYSLMGVLAVLLTFMSLVVGIGILRNTGLQISHLVRYSLAYGLIATFALTLITAAYMAAQTGHAVLPEEATQVAHSDGLFFMGWLRQAGDLRVAHFFATHAMHFVPLIGLLCSLVLANITQATAKIISLSLAGVYALFVLGTFAQAIAGKSFLW